MGRDAERLGRIEKTYRENFHRFLRVALAITGDREHAFDAVQDAFASAIKRRTSFRDEGPIEAWLWRSVVNASLQVQRTALLERRVLPRAQTSLSNGSPELSSSGLEIHIAQLPERQRLAVFLRYFADLNYRTIAEVLGIETGTVSATLSAAHATLRRALEGVER